MKAPLYWVVSAFHRSTRALCCIADPMQSWLPGLGWVTVGGADLAVCPPANLTSAACPSELLAAGRAELAGGARGAIGLLLAWLLIQPPGAALHASSPTQGYSALLWSRMVDALSTIVSMLPGLCSWFASAT